MKRLLSFPKLSTVVISMPKLSMLLIKSSCCLILAACFSLMSTQMCTRDLPSLSVACIASCLSDAYLKILANSVRSSFSTALVSDNLWQDGAFGIGHGSIRNRSRDHSELITGAFGIGHTLARPIIKISREPPIVHDGAESSARSHFEISKFHTPRDPQCLL